MTTVEIRHCDIPSYLHAGGFYRNLDSDDSESLITIPADCFQMECQIAATIYEFRQLLRVNVFWILDQLPTSVLDFCYDHDYGEWKDEIIELPGDVRELLERVYGEQNMVPIEDIIRMGRWDLIHHSIRRMSKTKSAATAAAAKVGNLEVLKLLHEEGFPWHHDTCSNASLRGHLLCLIYAHENGCAWDERVYSYAARQGRLDIIQYAHQQGLEWNGRYDVCVSAAESGYLECLIFAHENDCPWDGRTTAAAARGGQMDCLLYTLVNGCPVDQWACRDACSKGRLACLDLLYQWGAPWDTETPALADLTCLEYLFEHHCPWDNSSLRSAARRGSAEILRYAIERGCACDSSLLKDTTYAKKVEGMRYLTEDQLLTFDEEVFKMALLNANLACLQYLLDQGCPYLEAKFTAGGDWRYTAHNQDRPEFVPCVKFVLERGWVPDEAFLDFVRGRAPECAAWLKENTIFLDDSDSEEE